MVDKDKQHNVVRLRQPKQEAKFTRSFIEKFKPTKKGNFWATNYPYLCIRTQKSSRYYTVKKNKTLGKGAITVVIGDIHSITLDEAVKQNQNNVALISSGVNPNKTELGIQAVKEPTIYEYIERRLDRLERVGGMSKSAMTLNRGLLRNHLIDLGNAPTFSSLTEKQLEEFYLSKSSAIARQCKSLLGATFEKLSPKQKKDNENPREVIARLELSTKKQKTKKDVYMRFGNQRGDIGRFFEALTLAERGYVPDTYPDGTDLVVIPPITTSRTSVDILMMYLLTSVRKENIVSLKWTEVDWKTETITFLVPKGQAKEDQPIAQELPMSPYLKALLEFRLKNSPKSPYVFPSIQNPKNPMNEKSIDHFANRLALVMCCFGQWHEDEDNPIDSYLKKGEGARSYTVFNNFSKLVKTSKGDELNKQLNRMGTKPHGLRRTLGNIAEAIGVGERTIQALLNRSASDVDSKHYIEVQEDNLKQGLHACHKAIDNRIAEYLSLSMKKKGDTEYFESPILEFYGLKKQGIEKDKAYLDCGHEFTDLNAQNRDYHYGDIEL